MKLSQLVGKKVFSLYDAKFIGTIFSVTFSTSYEKIKGIYFFDEEDNEFYIDAKNIYNIGEIVVIKNSSKFTSLFPTNLPISIIGKNAITTDGEIMTIVDCMFDEKYNISSFITEKEKTMNPKTIKLVSSCVVCSEISIKKFKPKTSNKVTIPLEKLKVNILKMDDDNILKESWKPQKITISSDSLVGKRLIKDVIGKNNELILKKEQVLTTKAIELAKQHEKLNELFYSVY